jgi:hypothetical protein
MPQSEDLKKQMAERLHGWKLLPDGQIAYVPYFESASFPMSNGLLAIALRFDGRRKGQTESRVEQLQLGLTPQQCKALAEQLLNGVAYFEKEMKPGPGKPN